MIPFSRVSHHINPAGILFELSISNPHWARFQLGLENLFAVYSLHCTHEIVRVTMNLGGFDNLQIKTTGYRSLKFF